jgi:hypothetical protein
LQLYKGDVSYGAFVSAECISEDAVGKFIDGEYINKDAVGMFIDAECIDEDAVGMFIDAECIAEDVFGEFTGAVGCLTPSTGSRRLPVERMTPAVECSWSSVQVTV